MTEKKTKKLNKFVLYVSSIVLALFGILYSFGEVKAETNFTEEDIIAYYPLNETCNDYFDNYNLSLHDAGGVYSISWVDTFFGNGINVKGSATSNTTGSSYCYSNDIDYIFPSNDGDEFSISFWFKAGTTPTQSRLFSYGTREYPTTGKYGLIDFIIYSSGEGQFFFNTSGNYTDVYMTLPSGTFQYDDTIYHVVIVGQWGSNMTSKFKTYVNGSVVSPSVTGTATALPRINQKYAYNGLSLGANSYYQYDPYGQFGYNGDMGEFAIFNRILTSDEVALLGEKALSDILSSSGGGMLLEDPTSGIMGPFMFEMNYRCAQNSTCIIRYKYNQNYIPKDTNIITFKDPDFNVISTSTIESFSELGKNNGSSRITVEIASTTPIGSYRYLVAAEEDTDRNWAFAAPINIQVFDGSIPDATYVWDTKEDISTLWGDSYTLACSTEEWAEADDANFFNMIRLKCHTTKTTLDIFFSTINVAKNVFSNVYESGKTLLKNMFPFNMIYKVKYQWDRSANLSLPLDLILIENTVNSGELSVKINKELLSSNEDIYWVLWGDDLWAENSEVKALFDFIRTLSKYFMWALFLLGLYKMGADFFNEYMYENKLSSQRNSDWQYDKFKD